MTHSKSSLKNKELEKLNKRVKYWANLLGIDNWKFKVKKGWKYFASGEETVGEIETFEQFKLASIILNPDAGIIDEFPEALDVAILHELIHALTAKWNDVGKRLIELNFSEQQKQVASAILNQAMETSVAEIACAIYCLYKKLTKRS